MKNQYNISLRFILDQKDEDKALQEICNLIGFGKVSSGFPRPTRSDGESRKDFEIKKNKFSDLLFIHFIHFIHLKEVILL